MTHSRNPGLDTLRSLAILVVMCFHLEEKTSVEALKSVGHYGWGGVDLFFALSGYLIAHQLFRSLRETGRVGLGSFYRRRAFRILPGYLVVLFLYFTWPDFREGELKVPLWRFLTFTQNFGLHFGAFSHAWSLCIEEQFYWLFPLLVIALHRKPRLAGWVFGGVVLCGMFLRGVIWADELKVGLMDTERWRVYATSIYYPTYSRLDGLTFGVGVAAIRNYRPALWGRIAARANWVAGAGCALVAGALVLFENRYLVTHVIVDFPLLSAGAALLVASAASGQGWLARARLPGATGLATLAYCLYLTHKQVFHFVMRAFTSLGWTDRGGLFVGVVILGVWSFAWILHVLVERPFLLWRDRFETHRTRSPVGSHHAISRPVPEPACAAELLP